MPVLIYALAAACTAALTLALLHRFAREGEDQRLSVGLVAVVVLGAAAWFVTVPLAVWGIASDAYRSVGGDEVAGPISE